MHSRFWASLDCVLLYESSSFASNFHIFPGGGLLEGTFFGWIFYLSIPHTRHRIALPELNLLNNGVTILILAVSSDFKDFARPLGALGEAVNPLEERMYVLCGWRNTRFNLGGSPR